MHEIRRGLLVCDTESQSLQWHKLILYLQGEQGFCSRKPQQNRRGTLQTLALCRELLGWSLQSSPRSPNFSARS